jgi:hypothetical protein
MLDGKVHMRILSIICFGLLTCGCQTKGDLGRTVVSMVAQYGGHTRTTAAIPELSGRWNVKSADSKSFEAHFSGVPFADFKSFMQQVYGDTTSTSVTPGHIEYRASDIGVWIEYFDEWNGIGFICHRGVHVTQL